MSGQRLLVALALIAGAIAGAIYYAGSQRVSVVVAARDIGTVRSLGAADVELRALPPDALPDGALSSVDDAVGKVLVIPAWRGQPIVSRALADDTATFQTGLALPTGLRAIAIPATAASAVGGAIVPGARVDVLAVPVLGRAPAGRTTELLATGALVLDVRTESGGAFPIRPAASPAPDRIGSVVIAIMPTDELRFADRIATSTFVLAFASSR